MLRKQLLTESNHSRYLVDLHNVSYSLSTYKITINFIDMPEPRFLGW